jgi:hypothetical protein
MDRPAEHPLAPRRALNARAHALALTLALAGLGSLLALPAARASGGDGYEENAYAPEHHVTEAALPGYAAGRLGVVPGSYWRVYLALAWRAAQGHPLSAAETAALNVDGWHVGPTAPDWQARHDEDATGIAAWLAARAQAGAAPSRSRPSGPRRTTASS